MKKPHHKSFSQQMPEHAPIGLELAVILGTNVERMRLAQGLNKTKFSMMAGMSRPTLDKIESGQCNATLLQLEKLSKALDVSVGELLSA